MRSKSTWLFLLVSFFMVFWKPVRAQIPDTASNLSMEGYVDAYYAWYSDSVGIANFQKFPTVSPRSNSFGLNILQFSANYTAPKARAKASLHFGDIPASSWSGTYNFIQEAYAGLRLGKKLWFDGGLFRTHVGTELLTPRENIASSIAVVTYFEPYYESGFRLDYLASDKLEIALYALNGYNIYTDNNSKKSFGASVLYTINKNCVACYTDYLGDDALAGNQLHFYNNAFMTYTAHKIKLQLGADYCIGQNADTAHKNMASMYGGLVTLKYQAKKHFGVYGRASVFQDPQGFMSGVFSDKNGRLTGYKLSDFTAGLEYIPAENAYIRLEGRTVMADKSQLIFTSNHQRTNYRFEAMLNMGLSFDMGNVKKLVKEL